MNGEKESSLSFSASPQTNIQENVEENGWGRWAVVMWSDGDTQLCPWGTWCTQWASPLWRRRCVSWMCDSPSSASDYSSSGPRWWGAAIYPLRPSWLTGSRGQDDPRGRSVIFPQKLNTNCSLNFPFFSLTRFFFVPSLTSLLSF